MKLAKCLLANTEYISYLSKRLLNNIYSRITQIQNGLVNEKIDHTDASCEEENMLVAMNSRFTEFNSFVDIEQTFILDEPSSEKDTTQPVIDTAERTKSTAGLVYGDRDTLPQAENLLTVNSSANDEFSSTFREEMEGFFIKKVIAKEKQEAVKSKLKIYKKNFQLNNLLGLNNIRQLYPDFRIFKLRKVLKDIFENGQLVEEANLPSNESQTLTVICENANNDENSVQTEGLRNETNILRYFPSDDYENVIKVLEVNEEQFRKLDNFLEGLESEQDEREEEEQEREGEGEVEEEEKAETEEPIEQDENTDDSPTVEYSIEDLLVKGSNHESVLQTILKITNANFINNESSHQLLKQLNHAEDCSHLLRRDNEKASLIAQVFSNPVASIFDFYFSASNINPVGNCQWDRKDDEIYYSNDDSKEEKLDIVDRKEEQFKFDNKSLKNYYEVNVESECVTENKHGFDFKKNLYNMLSNKYEKRVSDLQKSCNKEGFDVDKINYYTNILQSVEKKPSIIMKKYYPPSSRKDPQLNECLYLVKNNESCPLVTKSNECFLPSKYCVSYDSSKLNSKIVEKVNKSLIHENSNMELTKVDAYNVSFNNSNGDKIVHNMESQIEYFMKLASGRVYKFTGYNAMLNAVESKIVRSFIEDKLINIINYEGTQKEIMCELIKLQYENQFGSIFYKKEMSSGDTIKSIKPTNTIKKKRQFNATSKLVRIGKIHCTFEHMLIISNPYLRVIPKQYIHLSTLEKFFNLSILRHIPDFSKREELNALWNFFSFFITNKQPVDDDSTKHPFVTNSKIIFQLLKTIQQCGLGRNFNEQTYPYPKRDSKNQSRRELMKDVTIFAQKVANAESSPQEEAKLLDANMKQFCKLEKKVIRNMLLNQNCLKILENSGCFFDYNIELIQSKPKEIDIVNRTTNAVVKKIEDLIMLTEKSGDAYNDLHI
ncbi:uncharacterized protein LOC108745109 isoform X2 [Agrilus planipennis]|uniref:Uncharacterized protein LOC108745109 isoform X2 n=1 Tax=Agrilus planipennis TaxID=224129 RepID=A0A1W4XW23_AGRPL|nr:uncharacterized protein LOC108745109 isoform X2 [Agrilus planipennis]